MASRYARLFTFSALLVSCNAILSNESGTLTRSSAGSGGSGRGGASGSGARGGALSSSAAGDAGAGRSGAGAGGIGEAGADGGGQAGAAGAAEPEPCPSATHRCGGSCVSNQSVASCGTACEPCPVPSDGSARCDGTRCSVACNEGFTVCGESCVDTRTNSANCGGCGKACAVDEACRAGACTTVTGCSDGTREGFVDTALFPDIAGCLANWEAQSMRSLATGVRCGKGLALCPTPADACSKGWHVCAAPPYGPSDITNRATVTDCQAQPGRYAAAVGDRECEPCDPGFGAACCGSNCVQQNGNCLYPGLTTWFGVVDEHTNTCGDTASRYANEGVLCCRNP